MRDASNDNKVAGCLLRFSLSFLLGHCCFCFIISHNIYPYIFRARISFASLSFLLMGQSLTRHNPPPWPILSATHSVIQINHRSKLLLQILSYLSPHIHIYISHHISRTLQYAFSFYQFLLEISSYPTHTFFSKVILPSPYFDPQPYIHTFSIITSLNSPKHPVFASLIPCLDEAFAFCLLQYLFQNLQIDIRLN